MSRSVTVCVSMSKTLTVDNFEESKLFETVNSLIELPDGWDIYDFEIIPDE